MQLDEYIQLLVVFFPRVRSELNVVYILKIVVALLLGKVVGIKKLKRC